MVSNGTSDRVLVRFDVDWSEVLDNIESASLEWADRTFVSGGATRDRDFSIFRLTKDWTGLD